MLLKIVNAPNKVLNEPAKKITTVTQRILDLVRDMEETLINEKDPEGVGLAAPQVGVSLSIFIVKPDRQSKTKIFINPKILNTEDVQPKSAGDVKKKNPKRHPTKMEGCLSVPRIWAPLKRAQKVHLEYQTLDGEVKREWFHNFDAVVVQHEVDHLEGILFTNRCLQERVTLYEEQGQDLVPMKT